MRPVLVLALLALASAAAAATNDRYGPQGDKTPAQHADKQSDSGRWLTWPGKAALARGELATAAPASNPNPGFIPQAPLKTAQAAAPAERPPAQSKARYYSLHRAYGLAPDPIPGPSDASPYVLMGPSDPAPASAEDPPALIDRPY